MLTAENLECVRGERRLFSALNFRLDAGELLQVEGPNGSGKTSLLRMVCGLLAPAAGEIRWRGESVKALAEDYLRQIFYLGHAPAIKEEFSASENLAVSCALAAEPQPLPAILEALARLGLAKREALPAKFLSQGQRRRVALARLLLTRRPLWVLDEPFVALDAAAVRLLSDIVAQHLARGGSAMLTSHQDVSISARVHKLALGA